MTIYRVSFRRVEDGEHTGFGYFPSKRRAVEAIRAVKGVSNCDLRFLRVTRTKAGMVSALNFWASHADNG